MDKELLAQVAATLQVEIRRVFLANMGTLDRAWKEAVRGFVKGKTASKNVSYVSTDGLAHAFDPQATYASVRVTATEDGILDIKCNLVLSGAKVKAWADSHSVYLSTLNNQWRQNHRKNKTKWTKRWHQGNLVLERNGAAKPEDLIISGDKYPGGVGVVGSIWKKRNATSARLGYLLPFLGGKAVKAGQREFYRHLNWKDATYSRTGQIKELLIQKFVESAGLKYVANSMQTNGVWSAKATLMDLEGAHSGGSKSSGKFSGMLEQAYSAAYEKFLSKTMEKN